MPIKFDNDYERKEYRKLRQIIEAARLNNAEDGIRIETEGSDPHVRFMIKAYVLDKFILKAGEET